MDWVKAPPLVELEIRGVWLEDEMPDEIKTRPGRVPFTLGVESQEWVDSMLEIKDAGKYIVGRPRPVAPIHHPPLGSQPAPQALPRQHDAAPSLDHRRTVPPAPATPTGIHVPASPRTRDRPRMPDIPDYRPEQTADRGELELRPGPGRMPDIDDRSRPVHPMPAIGDAADRKVQEVADAPEHEPMPDIDGDRIEHRSMPDIGEG